jgi:hypothetical protein
MPSMMDHVADVATGAVELHRFSKLYTFPDFVKQASTDTSLVVPPGTSPTSCADPVRKQFWCHTKAACWLSHLFYEEKRAEFHPKDRVQIEKRLASYADFFKIKSACDGIKARWAELHKTAESHLPDSAYAYVWTGENGTKDRRLPLRTRMEVKAAAEYVEKYRDSFSYLIRQTMCGKILEKAANLGAAVENTEFLERQCGRGVCDPAEVVAMIEKRAALVPDGNLRTQFLKMAGTVRDLPRQALHPDMLVKLAETVDQLDRSLGLVARYGPGLARPEDVIFKATFGKVASDLARHVATTSGKYYEKEALGRLPLADVEALFGTDFASSVSTPLGEIDTEKMAEQIATLPRPDAQLLDGLLGDHGITPSMHKAAASRQGFERSEMERIADQYGK